MLDKVGDLLLMPDEEFATTEQVAKYYKTENKTIDSIVARNRDGIASVGLKSVTKLDIELALESDDSVEIVKHQSHIEISQKGQEGNLIKIANRGANLFPRKAILRIAFLLRDSEVAAKVRRETLSADAEIYYEFSEGKLLQFKKYEKDMEYFLKAFFGETTVRTQVPCGKYSLDFVIDETIHIEVNEHGHSGYCEDKEKERKDYILYNTDYWSFDFNPQKDDKFNLIYNIFELYEHIGYPSSLLAG